MKHSVKLLILFVISGAATIFKLMVSYLKYPTLEEDVSKSAINFMKSLPKGIDINSFPEFCQKDVAHALGHFTENGVTHFHVEVWAAIIVLVSVMLMASFKRVGFKLYILGQAIGFASIFIGYGFNTTLALGALIYLLLAWFFVSRYNAWFIKGSLKDNTPDEIHN